MPFLRFDMAINAKKFLDQRRRDKDAENTMGGTCKPRETTRKFIVIITKRRLKFYE